ncbi:beta strand repeat-containing protein, partial [Aquabacterium sp.]|uniref:beta strand repeat-containing protein n=1 Tax=Aquabacterium sp. TaxID=1872578 RepID=UPI002C5A9BB1
AGTLAVSNASTWTGGTMSGTGSSTFSGGLAISGAAAKTLDQRDLILAGASSWAGNSTIAFSNGAVLTNNGSFADQNAGSVNLTSSGTGNRFANAGTYTKSGAGTTTVNTAFTNNGTLALNAGGLNLTSGVSGSGSASVASGATLSLGANSTVGSMVKAGTLALGPNNLSVALDYNNTGSGVGNAYNRHAGVTGTGQILALGSVQQTLSGDLITLGNTANAVLTLASGRVGDAPITTSFKINNVGSGASLRGAIQTGGVSSAALSGSGVAAQNWGAVASGGSTGAYTVTYSPTAAGQSLAGQSLSIVNNFDNVAGQTLSISGGKVYAPAVAQLGSSAMNFGIVHVGDTVGGGVTVRNAATVAGLNDVLQGTASGGGGAFVVGGNLAGLAAGGQDSSSLKVGLDTSRAGVYRGTADLAFASHNADMSDLALGSQQLALSAQVNNYAEVGLAKAGGAGSLGGGGHSFTLDFGTVTQGDVVRNALLQLFNSASGPADLLSGSFDLTDVDPAHNFTLAGFGAFGGLEAGDELSGLSVSFGSHLLGTFDEWIVIHAAGSNASGYNEALGDVWLHLIGSVRAGVPNAVPEPGTYALVLVGLLSLVAVRRRQCKPRQEAAAQ